MDHAPTKEDLSKITLAIQAYPQNAISGAKLGTLIRTAAPGLDFRQAVGVLVGPGAFTKFVDQFLSGVLNRVGHNPSDNSGGDWMFEKLPLKPGAEQAVHHASPLIRQDYWNAYVRPSDSRLLVFDPVSGSFDLRSPNEGESAANLTVIEKVSPEEFRAISDEFIARLKTNEQTLALAEKLELARGYNEFIALLNGAGYAYFNDWSVHRRDRLRKLFLSRLDSLGLDVNIKQRLLDTLVQSQFDAKEASKQRAREVTLGRHNDQPHASSLPLINDDITRRAIKEVIDKLSVSEIRALPIPFGYALDAIQLSMHSPRPLQK